MRTGLAASTVTPGSTAPDVSFTTPVSLPGRGRRRHEQEDRYRWERQGDEA